MSDTTERDRWHFDDRWYEVTMSSVVSHLNRDGMALELDDIGPSPGRGVVLEAFHDDDTGHMTFTSHTSEPLPFLLIEAFIAEARRRLPPISDRCFDRGRSLMEAVRAVPTVRADTDRRRASPTTPIRPRPGGIAQMH